MVRVYVTSDCDFGMDAGDLLVAVVGRCQKALNDAGGG